MENEIKKQLRLEVLPPVLVLQLSRFSYDYNKMIPVKVSGFNTIFLRFAFEHFSIFLRSCRK